MIGSKWVILQNKFSEPIATLILTTEKNTELPATFWHVSYLFLSQFFFSSSHYWSHTKLRYEHTPSSEPKSHMGFVVVHWRDNFLRLVLNFGAYLGVYIRNLMHVSFDWWSITNCGFQNQDLDINTCLWKKSHSYYSKWVFQMGILGTRFCIRFNVH